ncbi:MAG: hypothetical protein JSR82_11330 [Verrucomicrobia bacterium]|nr:hypothetical protein [Verrucomicrobiota bacterium]
MNPSESVPPPWKIWENPIFRRYCRSRLRPKHLFLWLGITLIVGGFMFFLLRTGGNVRGGLSMADAERAAVIPLLILQALILFGLGTGQVATGMTAEADEGTLDYQRLTPLSPLTKVLGYLFGLPVREWLMTLSLLPFVMWGIVRGDIPLKAWGPLFIVFFSSAVLYHLTGMVAGTVVKNRRWAFLVSIGVVFSLYTVVPQVSRFGLVCFKYLTIQPVFFDAMPLLVPAAAKGALKASQAFEPEVLFFGIRFPEALFTICTQAALILTFVTMLLRRWRNAESHLLGKFWALGLFAWVHLLLLGNALPMIETGQLFPTREFRRRVRDSVLVAPEWKPTLAEALGMVGLFGLVTLLLLAILTTIITASEDGQVRGLRRARKLKLPRVPLAADAASSVWFAAAMAVLGAASWWIFTRALLTSSWFPEQTIPTYTPLTFGLVLLTAAIGYQALLEGWNGKWPFIGAMLASILPVLVGVILGTGSDAMLKPAIWLAGVSPAAAPFFAIGTLFPDFMRQREFSVVPQVFWTWQAVLAVVAVFLSVKLAARHRQRRAAAQL